MVNSQDSGLKWGENPNREPGKVHIEWHTPCGCAFHSNPFPHIHPCGDEHKRPDLHGPSAAATSMRSACVEKVKEMRAGWHDQYVKANSDTREALVIKELLYAKCQAATCIAKELETLSIEQPKE